MSNIYTPSIIHETAQGLSRCPIEDHMLASRELLLYGTVDQESVDSLITQLLYLSRQDPDAPVTLYINSPGGQVSSGLALYDVMQAIPCPVDTVCMGLAASMAAVLFAVGRKRSLLPHSRVMIHDPLVMNVSGSALALQSCSEDLMRTRETIAKILAGASGKPLEEIYAATAKDTYFYAQQAVEFGLADEVITAL